VGLMKTAATVAVASSVHGRVQRRQQARWAAQDPAAAGVAPPPPPAQFAPPPQPQPAYVEPAPAPVPAASAPAVGAGDRLAQLKQLGELLSAGVLTQAEFDQEKTRILNG
jgi:Short C-terminal domain